MFNLWQTEIEAREDFGVIELLDVAGYFWISFLLRVIMFQRFYRGHRVVFLHTGMSF